VTATSALLGCSINPQHPGDVRCVGVSQYSGAEFVVELQFAGLAMIFEVDIAAWQTVHGNFSERTVVRTYRADRAAQN
jgi:hypothetical protein